MTAKRKTSFRPSVEAFEDRSLPSGGLSAPELASLLDQGQRQGPAEYRRAGDHDQQPEQRRRNAPRHRGQPGRPHGKRRKGGPLRRRTAAPVAPPAAPAPAEPPPAAVNTVRPAPTMDDPVLTALSGGAGLQGGDSAVPSFAVYEVTLSGVAGGYAFTRSGWLAVVNPVADPTTANGANPREVLLVSGHPTANPETGSIWFATNNVFYSGAGDLSAASALDLAYVAANEQAASLWVNPDLYRSRMAPLNNFNATSNFTSDVYQIQSGDLGLEFLNGGQNVHGYASLSGSGYIFYSDTLYTAEITGTRVR
jgi:hypothetical protein